MKVFPIAPDINIKDNLDEYQKELCQMAITNGAESANIVNVSNIVFNQKVLSCPENEKSFNYPKVIYEKDPIQDILKKYQWAVVFKIDQQQGLKRVYEITAKIESHCFYHNFHLAVALAAGNCRRIFCSTQNECQAMTIGKGCAFPMIARPSIESCGIDLHLLAKEAGMSHYHQDKHYLGMIFVD